VRFRPPIAGVIFAVSAVGITVNTLVSPLLPEIIADFGVSSAFAGVLVAAGSLPGVVLAPVAGLLADRYGRRTVLVPALMIFGLAGLGVASAPNAVVFVAMRLLQGCGAAGLINLAVVMIGDWWEETDRARMIGRNGAVLTTCLATFPVVSGWAGGAFGWRVPLAAYGVAVLVAVLAAGLPRATRQSQPLRVQLANATPYLRSRAMFGAAGAGLGVFVLVFGLVLTLLPVYAESTFGLDPSQRGVLLATAAVPNAAMATSLGRLRARFSQERLFLAAGLVLATALVLAALAGSIVALFVAVGVFGAGEGLMVPSLQERSTSVAPASSRGLAVATFVAAARGGQTVGPVSATGFSGVFGPQATFAAGAALALALPVILGAVPPPGRRRREPATTGAG